MNITVAKHVGARPTAPESHSHSLQGKIGLHGRCPYVDSPPALAGEAFALPSCAHPVPCQAKTVSSEMTTPPSTVTTVCRFVARLRFNVSKPESASFELLTTVKRTAPWPVDSSRSWKESAPWSHDVAACASSWPRAGTSWQPPATQDHGTYSAKRHALSQALSSAATSGSDASSSEDHQRQGFPAALPSLPSPSHLNLSPRNEKSPASCASAACRHLRNRSTKSLTSTWPLFSTI